MPASATETWGIALVKDEADIVGYTVTRMLGEVDRVLIADNGSTDGTRDILADLERVTVIDDSDPAYYQSRKVTALAHRAAAGGAGWVIPFDADEAWYSPHGRIADVLASHDCATAPAAVYDHVATADDDDTASPLERIGWRRQEPNPLPKVACRPLLPVTVAQGNHGASYPQGAAHDLLVVRHYPYRSVDQFVSKVRNGSAAYRATDLPEHEGQHWRDYGRLLHEGGPEALGDVFRRWFWSPAPDRDRSLIYDPCP